MATEQTMEICPSCNGAKQTRALVNYGSPRGCVWEMVDCPICHGTGEMSWAEAMALRDGRALRDARVAAGKSIKEAANERGMTLREYNDLEWGRAGQVI